MPRSAGSAASGPCWHTRSFFEVDRYSVAVTALSALAEQGKVSKETVQQAIEKYGMGTFAGAVVLITHDEGAVEALGGPIGLTRIPGPLR